VHSQQSYHSPHGVKRCGGRHKMLPLPGMKRARSWDPRSRNERPGDKDEKDEKLAEMLRKVADVEKQSKEGSYGSHSSRLLPRFATQSAFFNAREPREPCYNSFRQPVRLKHSPSPSPHGRLGLSNLAKGIFYLPEIPGTPVEKQKPEKTEKAKDKSKRKREKTGLQDGYATQGLHLSGYAARSPEVSLEAARVFWDVSASQDRGTRHRSSQDEDRRQPSNTQGTTRYPNYAQPSGPGVPELSHRVGLPQQVAKEAAHLFQRFAEIPKGGTIFDGKLQITQLTEVLVALCDLSDASELDKKFADRAFRAADRDSGGFIDIEEFAIWYSSFCFAEEVTVRPQVRQTRELARQMGLEIWAIEKFRVAFDKYDADGSGEIEFDEFSDMVQELLRIPTGHELPHDRLMTMWRTADVQQKGYLDFREFCFFYVRMVSMEEGCDPIRDYYRNVRNVPVAPL